MKILVVVDMQNDFIDGALGTKEAVEIVPKVVEKIQSFDGKIMWPGVAEKLSQQWPFFSDLRSLQAWAV